MGVENDLPINAINIIQISKMMTVRSMGFFHFSGALLRKKASSMATVPMGIWQTT
jgi:hypothetical protein